MMILCPIERERSSLGIRYFPIAKFISKRYKVLIYILIYLTLIFLVFLEKTLRKAVEIKK
jgi:hypothetical protein